MQPDGRPPRNGRSDGRAPRQRRPAGIAIAPHFGVAAAAGLDRPSLAARRRTHGRLVDAQKGTS